MRIDDSAHPAERGSPLRIAWLLSFAITLVLIGVLLMARSAQAATLPLPALLGGSGQVLAAADDEEADESVLEGEGEEVEGEECEVVEEGEEGEVEECVAVEETSPPECVLSSADAIVSANVGSGKVRLDVRYTAFSTAAVAVEYRLRGAKGQLNLGQETKRFGRSGVLHHVDSLGKAQMGKVAAAREFTVELRAVNSPRYCRELYERHLTIRRHSPGGLVWVDPESSFRPRR